MRIVFINPGAAEQIYQTVSYNVAIEPPYWVASWAASERERGHDVFLIDAEVEHIAPGGVALAVKDYNPDKVIVVALGITPSCSSTPKMVAATAICKAVRFVPQVGIAGIHSLALPEQTLKETGADFIYHAGDTGKMPAWDFLPMSEYRCHNWHGWGQPSRQPYASLYTSFGCPYKCDFCTVNKMHSRVSFLDPDVVLDRIDFLHNNFGIKNIKFADEIFNLNRAHVEAICKGLIERNYGLNIWSFCYANSMTDRLAEVMVKAGIRGHAYGIESGNDKVREGVLKHVTTDKIRDAIRMSRRAGAIISGDYIFGLPDDDMGFMQSTLDLAKEILAEHTNFYCCMAYPGSYLYKVTPREDLPDTWDAYSQYSPKFKPLPTKYLSPKEVLAFRDNAFIEYYSQPEYQRMIEKLGGLDDIKEVLAHKLRRDLLET